jgi:hypothetical protein
LVEPVLRERVLEPFLVEPLREEVLRDVLELRDPGGEDVRVAMLRTLDHSSHQSLAPHVRVDADRSGRSTVLSEVGQENAPRCFTCHTRGPYGDPDHSPLGWRDDTSSEGIS